MVCDIPTLLRQACANGFDLVAEDTVLTRGVILQLLCNFSASGGITGTSGWTHGAGSPIANGISPVTYSTYTNDTDSSFWTVANGQWIQLV
jgi:hypothetical protein